MWENYKYLGKVKPKKCSEIESSKIGIGFETLDRDMWNVDDVWEYLPDLGVKWARVQSGWAKTESVQGVYDFAWLDYIVDKLLSCGVQPWLSLSYGNPVYTPHATKDGAGYPPVHTPEEIEGWKNYVRKTVQHYKNRITHYEVWNEPDAGFWGKDRHPEEYAFLLNISSKIIREEQPSAKVVGGGLGNAMSPSGLVYFEKILANGAAESCDIISYHGYKIMPEQYLSQEFASFLHVLNKYNPKLKYWQGETGCPSYNPPHGTHALNEMEVSEEIQRCWTIRRILIELGNNVDLISHFTMSDFCCYFLNGNSNQTAHYGVIGYPDRKPTLSYYSLQALASLLHNPLEVANGRFSFRMQHGDDENACTREQATSAYQVNLLRGNVPVYAWWLVEPVQNETIWKTVTLYFWLEEGLKLDDPVLINLATQEVYEIEATFAWRMNEFKNMPISNSPVIITDRSILLY